MFKKTIYFAILSLAMFASPIARAADAPAHFVNPVENLNNDPNFVPGDYDRPDLYAAQAAYLQNKTKLMPFDEAAKDVKLFTLGIGEITAVSTKNHITKVFGYFRNYSGVAEMGVLGIKKMELIIDMNSFDTGVPGRNNRILAILFESMKPQLSTTTVTFEKFDYGDKTFSEIGNGELHAISAKGTIVLNEMPKDITVQLHVTNDAGMWTVETASPLKLFISDYAFHNKPYDLIKACNHKAMGNVVEVNVKLALR